MRKLLLLALLLYDIVTIAMRVNNYDYDDGNKRHSFIEDRRNWRKKTMMKSPEMDHKDWEDRRRHDYDNPRYPDDMDNKGFGPDRQRPPDTNYNKRFDETDKLNMPNGGQSSEMEHMPYMDKDPEKKMSTMNCERQHERYEACFAGCASVTCDNRRDRLRPCYPFCEQGCVCVAPYVRDDRTHKCVLPDECTRGLKGIPDLGDES